MTPIELELILLGALKETPGTQADYFINEAKKAGISKKTLLFELMNCYNSLHERVNFIDYSNNGDYYKDENGERVYLKKNLNLLHYTSGKFEGHLSSDNISELLEPLTRFAKAFTVVETPDPPAPDQRLTHDMIALINYYNGITITENNAAGIAKESGWINKTSGRKIWQRYLYYTSKANRNGIPDNPTPTTKRNKIKLFKSVLPYLNDTAKQKAEAEIKLLKIKLQTDWQ